MPETNKTDKGNSKLKGAVAVEGMLRCLSKTREDEPSEPPAKGDSAPAED